MLPESAPHPLTVTCDNCGTSTQTHNGLDPDGELECPCCPEDHSHAGLGCRTITISGHAQLSGEAGGV